MHNILHELNQHLGVGVAAEIDTFLLQLPFQVGIVLYDAIMNYRKVLRLGIMWVSVARRRLAMSGPTRVRYTYSARDVLLGTIVLKVANLAFCLINVQVTASIEQCHAGTIVTTILQSS